MAETKEVTNVVRRIDTDNDTDFDPGEYNISELTEEIEGVEDTEWLEQVIAAEKDGKDRKGAKAALSSQYELALSGVSDEEEDTDESDSEVEDDDEPTIRLPNEDDGRQIRRKIAVGQLLADEMSAERQVMYGGSDGESWTTDEYIVLTKDDMGPGQFVTWPQRIYRSVALCMAEGDAERFQELVFEHEDFVCEFIDSNWERSITDALDEAGYSPDDLF